jgi:hypothetical protein
MTLDELHGRLAIDEDDLDSGLVQQPDLFYHVSDGFSTAVSIRDGVKLELEELKAEMDQSIRAAVARAREGLSDAELKTRDKLTETGLQNQIQGLPKVKELERKFLQSKYQADRWEALKNSYQQRSWALRELVTLRVRRQSMVAQEHGETQARRDMADDVERRAGERRREQMRR